MRREGVKIQWKDALKGYSNNVFFEMHTDNR